jgi:hypothetical protein
MIVEWPERGRGVLPAADLEIKLEHANGARLLSLRAAADWIPVLSALSSAQVPGVLWRGAADADQHRQGAEGA